MERNALEWRQDAPSMAELFREAEEGRQLRRGDLRWGVIVEISPRGMVIDTNARQQGIVPPEDLAKLPPAERESLQEGEEVPVYVTAVENTTGTVHLSLYLAKKEYDWLLAEQLQRENRFWEGRVSGYNKGGLIVPFGHIRGFVPASQITAFPRGVDGEEKLSLLAKMVGQELAFKVVEVDRRQQRLILSERLGRSAKQASRQRNILHELHKGDICRGRIRAMTDYGAFVDLGGMVGLIHRTELAWFRVEHPCEIVQEGQEVSAYVLRVNPERGRVSLSLKRASPDPWPTALERYRLDQLVEGRLIRKTGAGLFVLLDDGLLGFIAATDARQSGRLEDELAVGRRILARLVRIDGARRRLGLSLRRVQADEWEKWSSRRAGGEPTTGEFAVENRQPA